LWFFGHINASKEKYLPSAAFDSLEENSQWTDPTVTGEYKGGLTNIMIVRYADTPVGPYDELIWGAGKFHAPPAGKDASRITRIYVSSKDSVYNGRKNWNIVKEQAHFTFVRNPDAGPNSLPYSKISVAPMSDPENPFFCVEVKQTRFFGDASLPYSSKSMPMNIEMINPPLSQSPNWREDGKVGTNRWWALTPAMSGKAGFLWSNGGLEGGKYGDNKGFPDVQPWSLGMWLKDFALEFEVGYEPGVDKKDV